MSKACRLLPFVTSELKSAYGDAPATSLHRLNSPIIQAPTRDVRSQLDLWNARERLFRVA